LCDVDGVLTDGSIFIGGAREFKRFNIRDGLGLVLARRAGLKIGWVSARPSLATKLRADELKIHFLVQQGDKLSKTGAIEKLLAQEKLDWNGVCFVGDDVVDLGPLKRAGVSVAVADGVAEAKAAADFVTRAAGGRGAVRETIEMILQAQGKWEPVIAVYRQ
jgi:YrbI family 3-deoxy-D-manno-octulosonate 8-phosphate phosphatase